jgi:flagellar hook-basal body complex protein FliE
MSIDFLAPAAPIREPSLAVAAAPAIGEAAASSGTFGTLVSDGLRHVDAQLHTSDVDLQHLATGKVDNLHQIMIRLEETRLSFQLMMQVRNRLLDSYQEVMRMQV